MFSLLKKYPAPEEIRLFMKPLTRGVKKEAPKESKKVAQKESKRDTSLV
jgi:hypothetical protein